MKTSQIMEVLSIIEKHSDTSIKGWCETIVDCETDPSIINAAKYIHYWLEKADTIDDPATTKYNDYKEVR